MTYAARWALKRDAVNRAARSFYQAVGLTIVTSLGDLVVQLLERLVDSEVQGAVIDWAEVATWARHGAVAAVLLPIIAYWHRRALDPSRVPSLPPPSDAARR